MTPARSGTIALLATLMLDQASKLGLLVVYDLPGREPLALAPFASLIVVWNRGISYGLFQQGTDIGRWLLVGISLLATLALLVWIRGADSRSLGISLGLIAGGAAGNAIDRAAYGAVFDFVYLHAGGYSWYVFNVADAAIVAGVAGLIYRSVWPSAGRPAASGSAISHPVSRHYSDAVTGKPEKGRMAKAGIEDQP